MDLLENKTKHELHRSLIAEAAKAKNEIQCAKRDIDKAQSRLDFIIVLVNDLIKRNKD